MAERGLFDFVCAIFDESIVATTVLRIQTRLVSTQSIFEEFETTAVGNS